MNRTLVLRLCIVPFLLIVFANLSGCATAPVVDHAPAMVQLNDSYWADLSDVREITFKNVGSADLSNPYYISLVHRGTGDNSFNFTFTDQAAAFDAWKRLVKYLGGSLKESDWKSSLPLPPMEAKTFASTADPATDQSESYTNLRTDLAALASCRDDKLITLAEFDLGHARTIASFINVVKAGNVYHPVSGEMHAELVQLEALKKDRLADDNQATELHNSILVRHSMARP